MAEIKSLLNNRFDFDENTLFWDGNDWKYVGGLMRQQEEVRAANPIFLGHVKLNRITHTPPFTPPILPHAQGRLGAQRDNIGQLTRGMRELRKLWKCRVDSVFVYSRLFKLGAHKSVCCVSCDSGHFYKVLSFA